MKISRSKPVGGASPVSKTTGKAPAGEQGVAAPKVEPAAPTVDVNISDATHFISSAKAALSGVPDVRVERVSEIRLAVDSGAYKVDSQALAREIVNEALRESAALTPKKR
ncbi:MAG: flagellar biosynthesis anti-sigma factor FlgM [Candidatus Sumerlaeota bacterium]|nr:flagellar biosynthesis anti-sigma factor FlgM [Candidatus Sumerlaeota bacterium]